MHSSTLLGLESPRHVALRRGRGKRRRGGRGTCRKPLPPSPLAVQFLDKVVDFLVVVQRLFHKVQAEVVFAALVADNGLWRSRTYCVPFDCRQAQVPRQLPWYGTHGPLCGKALELTTALACAWLALLVWVQHALCRCSAVACTASFAGVDALGRRQRRLVEEFTWFST